MRLTASDRPGVAQPVPMRDVPARPWPAMLACALLMTATALAAWEWRMRTLELLPGDLGDYASAWAEQRRRIDTENVAVAIVGDSRILFDTNLDRFAALTGVQPVQLALAGSNGRPFLEELAADEDFKGLAIVGIAETSYFRKEIGRRIDALKAYRFESPSQRISYLLYRQLARVFGFLDEDYRLSKLVRRLDGNLRAGAEGPYGDPWKLIVTGDERRSSMWPRIEHDERLHAHARTVFQNAPIFVAPPVATDVIAMTLAATRTAVARIRARGGDVVFVRPPSAGPVRARENVRLPRASGWDALLAAAGVRGIHFEDDPAMQGLVLPEDSHLTAACAVVFTDAYVRALTALDARLHLRADAPAVLRPQDCNVAANTSSAAEASARAKSVDGAAP